MPLNSYFKFLDFFHFLMNHYNTNNLKNRLYEHNSGKVKSTKSRRPFKVVYYEVCYNQADALHREKYLKSSYGKRYIKNRLKNYLANKVWFI